MLEKYNATGHISGHDHCLEHVDEGRGPVYAVVGAGDECCYHNKKAHLIPKGALKFAMWNDGSGSPIEAGFGSMVATHESLTLRYHSANGTLLYQAEPVFPRTLN
jgi:acid phosphatase/tartrate-resistant acid phosphatase type 5